MSKLRILLALMLPLSFAASQALAFDEIARNIPDGTANQALKQMPDTDGAKGTTCLPIPDDGYNGSTSSMGCGTIPNTFSGTVGDVDVSFGVNHSFVGDLVFKVIDPTGQRIATVMSRPGLSESVDDGSGCCGNNADMTASAAVTFDDQSGGTSAENMGSNGATVCSGDGICTYTSDPGAAANGLAVFNGLQLTGGGNWTFCAGDAASGDSGELCNGAWNVSPAGGGGGGFSADIVNPMADTDCLNTNVSFTLESNGGTNGGNVRIAAFDDMVLEFEQTVFVGPGFNSQQINFSYNDPEIGQSAPGIGLVLFDSQNNVLDSVDPLFVNEQSNCGVNSPVVTLSLNPNPVPAGQPFTISWSATNATGFNPCISVLGSPTAWAQTQFRPNSGSETYVVNSPGPVDFAMQCESESGLLGEAAIRLTVGEPSSAPMVDLNATPGRTAPNGVIFLSWTTNISSGGLPCTPTGGGSTTWQRQGPLPANGRRAVAAPMSTGTVDFGLQCSNGGQSATDSASVMVTAVNDPPPPPRPTASSVTAAGTTVAGTSKRASITADGSALTFETTAANVTAILPDGTPHNDNNGQMDIFLKIAGNPNAVLCSIDENGPLSIGTSNARLAPDGAGATFESDDGQIRTFEGGLGRTRGITSSDAMGNPGNAASANPAINNGATMVAFDSGASNLVPGDGNGGMNDVFVKTPQTGEIALVSQGIGGAPANGESSNPSVSADGSTIFFQTTATNMEGLPSATDPEAPKGGGSQICGVRNPTGGGRSAGCVSVSTINGQPGDGPSRNVRMNATGDIGVFESDATNLVAGDTNGVTDVFWFTWDGSQVNGLVRISTDKNGTQGNGPSNNPSISGDGMTVTFSSAASNLDPPDTNGQSDAFMKYVQSGQIVRMDNTANGQEPNGGSDNPVISGDGSTVAFGSDADNFAPNDNNGSTDIFSVPAPQVIDADEPALIQAALPLPNPPNPNCSAGYYTAVVEDGPLPGISNGIFGIAMELDPPGFRELSGGLNFGGLIDVSQVGFAGANLANLNNEPQRLNVLLLGNPTSDPAGQLPVRVTIARRTATSLETVFEQSTMINISTPFETSLVVQPGYYEATVAPEGFPASAAGGEAEGQFLFSLTTGFVDRPGGGFQGGAVVGGYHAANPFGGVSAFAAICLGEEYTSSIRVLSAPTYGPNGAQDLQLRLLDTNNQDIYIVPGQ